MGFGAEVDGGGIEQPRHLAARKLQDDAALAGVDRDPLVLEQRLLEVRRQRPPGAERRDAADEVAGQALRVARVGELRLLRAGGAGQLLQRQLAVARHQREHGVAAGLDDERLREPLERQAERRGSELRALLEALVGVDVERHAPLAQVPHAARRSHRAIEAEPTPARRLSCGTCDEPYAKGAAAGGALAALAGVTLLLLAAATPSSDFPFLPSPAQPVAPVVKVAGESADPAPSGPGFLFTAVAQRRASRLESLAAVPARRPRGARAGRALIPPGGTPEEQDKVDRAAMTDSQRTAAAVAERALGKPVSRSPRAACASTTPPCPAARRPARGPQSGDVITAVDGTPRKTLAQLRQPRDAEAGPIVTISYTARRQAADAKVRLRASPDEPGRAILGIGGSDDLDITLAVPVTYSIGDVEGPSAGLAFALEVYSALTGRKPAAAAAWPSRARSRSAARSCPSAAPSRRRSARRESGAEVFLVPTQNLAEAREARRSRSR